MNVRGRTAVNAPREAVFAAICDPGALLEVIPGCLEINEVSAGEYRGRIEIRLPAIVGTYDARVRLVQADPASYGLLEGRVEGKAGMIEGRASFRLAEDGGKTVVDYEGTAVVSGPLARLDSRFIEGVAASLIDQGLARLGRLLQGVPVETAG